MYIATSSFGLLAQEKLLHLCCMYQMLCCSINTVNIIYTVYIVVGRPEPHEVFLFIHMYMMSKGIRYRLKGPGICVTYSFEDDVGVLRVSPVLEWDIIGYSSINTVVVVVVVVFILKTVSVVPGTFLLRMYPNEVGPPLTTISTRC